MYQSLIEYGLIVPDANL